MSKLIHRFFLSSAFLMLMGSPAQARQWVVFFNNSTTTASLDVDSIKGEGSTRDFWVKSVHQEKPMGYIRYNSSLSRSWVNCSARKIGSSSLTLYNIQGSPVYSARETDEPVSWSSVLPDTMGEAMLERICKLKTQESDRLLNPTPSPSKMMSNQQATSLIKGWLKAKQRIFAPPYDLNLASQLTVDPLYQDLSSRDGSVAWLKNNNSYYQYGTQDVESIKSISLGDNLLVISAYVLESNSLITNESIVKKSKGVERSLVRYEFIRIDNRWKLKDYRSL